jgi:hypothetical protein
MEIVMNREAALKAIQENVEKGSNSLLNTQDK